MIVETLPYPVAAVRIHRDSRSSVARLTVLLYALFILGVLAVAVAAESRGIPFGYLSRDPNNLARAPFYAGALSNLGVLLWTAGAAAALFGAAALRGRVAEWRLFAWAGLLSAIMAWDDVYMFHEVAAPRYLGIRQEAVLAAYAIGAAWWLLQHRHSILRREAGLLTAALVLFGISLLADLTNLAPPPAMLWEDGAKLAGIAGWSAWLCRQAYLEVTGAMSPTARQATHTPLPASLQTSLPA